jgi:hypothetical protein
MRFARALMVGVLGAGLVAMLGAQQPGGFGGFGGGFGGQGNPTSLVLSKAVQDELKMTEEQVTKIRDMGKDFMTRRMEILQEAGIDFKGGFGGGGFTPEMQEKMAAANAKANKAAYKDLEAVLKPDQISRLKQIAVQASGVLAFQDADVVERLKLTDQQKGSLKGIVADFQRDQREIMGFGGGKGGGKGGGGKGGGKGGFDPEKMAANQAKVQKLQREAIAKAQDLLTDDQKKTWAELTGPAFDTTRLTPAFPKKKD